MTKNDISTIEFDRPYNSKFGSPEYKEYASISDEWEYLNDRFRWLDKHLYSTTKRKIDGWSTVGDLRVIDFLSSLPINREGGVCEIGVQLGYYFIPLNQTVNEGVESVAVDIFDKGQKYNVSVSGGLKFTPEAVQKMFDSGSKIDQQREWFKMGMKSYDQKHEGKNVKIIQQDSMTLVPEDLGIRKFKFISVDGGHDKEHVLNDLRLVEKCITHEGVVILDDFLSPEYMGVTEGFFDYKNSGGSLVPFAMGGQQGKLYLCNYSLYRIYKQYMRMLKVRKFTDKLLGYDVDVLLQYNKMM